jgi:hypothetical protein
LRCGCSTNWAVPAGGDERRTVEADLGPVRYLATLVGQADEVVLQWFILVVALSLDPAAVLVHSRVYRRSMAA